MKYLKRIVLVIFSLYLLYLVKSALGINLSERYSAWEPLKFPVKSFIEHPIIRG